MPELPDDIAIPLSDDAGLLFEVVFDLEWEREDSDNPAESGWTCEAYLDGGFLSVPDRSDPHGFLARFVDLTADQVEKLLGKAEIKRLEALATARAVEGL